MARFENGVEVCDLATKYGVVKTAILTVTRSRDVIKAADVVKGRKHVFMQERPQIMDKIEMQQTVFIEEKDIAGGAVLEKV